MCYVPFICYSLNWDSFRHGLMMCLFIVILWAGCCCVCFVGFWFEYLIEFHLHHQSVPGPHLRAACRPFQDDSSASLVFRRGTCIQPLPDAIYRTSMPACCFSLPWTLIPGCTVWGWAYLEMVSNTGKKNMRKNHIRKQETTNKKTSIPTIRKTIGNCDISEFETWILGLLFALSLLVRGWHS